jgi:hypothetical protein
VLWHRQCSLASRVGDNLITYLLIYILQDIGNNVLNAVLSGRPREEVVEEVHEALRCVAVAYKCIISVLH